MGDGQAVGDAVDRLAAEWGRIDVLFNSAGVSIPGTLELDADTLDLCCTGQTCARPSCS